MIRFVLMTFFSLTWGFAITYLEKVASQFRLAMRAHLIRQLWILLLLGNPKPAARSGREADAKGEVFFFRGPQLVRLPA